MEKSFKKGEVVWAKVRGYSWWPGIVKKITLKISKLDNSSSEIIKKNNSSNSKEIRIEVKFIGDNSHSVLPLDKIEKFEKKYSEFSKTKKKPLIHSIKQAKKLIAGEISISDLNKNNILKTKEDDNKYSDLLISENSEDESSKRKKNDVIINF